MDDKYITLDELCRRLSVTVATGQNWLRLGKIESQYELGGRHYFEEEYASSLQRDLQSGRKQALRSRRNKSFVSGRGMYESYVSEDCVSAGTVAEIVDKVKSRDRAVTDIDVRMMLAICATELVMSAGKNLLPACQTFREENIEGSFVSRIESCGVMARLIRDILPGSCDYAGWLRENPDLADTIYIYQEGEDVLGLLYLSLKDAGNRKETGAYYTPTDVVRNMMHSISHLFQDHKSVRVLDPCCGTGNFLIQLPCNMDASCIYGNDIDPLSVSLSRINVALRYGLWEDGDIDMLYSNITCSDFLIWDEEKNGGMYDVIVGNPPWGSSYDRESLKIFKKSFCVVSGETAESSDMFVEKSLKLLSEGGVLAFVLPEAMTSVRSHRAVRDYMYKSCNIQRVTYLGEVFHKVQCPAVVLQLEKSDALRHCAGTQIIDGNRNYEIMTARPLDEDGFSFRLSDEEYELVTMLMNSSGCTTLKDHADFALGIVTGDNRKYVTGSKADRTEPVLKGSDIFMYRYSIPDRYIEYEPQYFQQTAPERIYRAPEKLLYRFVSSQLVFAYDDRRMLSLNSCNIVIPRLEGLSVKYILAVLNSRVARYIYRKRYHSMKVLRSHIESIPIPVVEKSVQECIEEYVNVLLDAATTTGADRFSCDIREEIYDRLDHEIRMLYGLDDDRYMFIKNELKKERNLL